MPPSPISVGLTKLAFTGLPNCVVLLLSVSLETPHTTNSLAVVVVMAGADQLVDEKFFILVADVKIGEPDGTQPLNVAIRATR